MCQFRYRTVLPLLAAIIGSQNSPVQAAPFFILKNAVAQCFKYDAPRDHDLRIAYNVPELPVGGGKHMETTITVMQMKARPGEDGTAQQADSSSMVQEKLQQTSGFLDFSTHGGGYVQVCVHTFAADKENPMRYSLTVMDKDDALLISEGSEKVVLSARDLEKEDSQAVRDELEALRQHDSMIKDELARFTHRARELEMGMEYSKERESEFHGKSVSLNKAVKYWPIFRMMILMIGGYLQANHVVQYMKRRQIY